MHFLIWLPVLLSGILVAQDPPVGIIDFYGLRQVSAVELRRALPFKEGDRLSENSDVVIRRLERVRGVSKAAISVMWAAEGKAIVYIGIEEVGAPVFRFRTAPTRPLRLPDDVTQASNALDKAWADAAGRGETIEDRSQGHALSSDEAVRAVQLRFVQYAARDLALLREVLRDSAFADQRAVAAEVIAYAADKPAIAQDLTEALKDPDDLVRSNALRGLLVLTTYAAVKPDSGVRVPWQAFVDLLNSLEWSDRNKAVDALFEMTERRDVELMNGLRTQVLGSLVEMARWKTASHALAAFWILARLAEMPEKDIEPAWKKGDREAIIRAATAAGKDLKTM